MNIACIHLDTTDINCKTPGKPDYLAGRLQERGQFKQAVGDGVELRFAQQTAHAGIIDLDGAGGQDARVRKAGLLGQAQKVACGPSTWTKKEHTGDCLTMF